VGTYRAPATGEPASICGDRTMVSRSTDSPRQSQFAMGGGCTVWVPYWVPAWGTHKFSRASQCPSALRNFLPRQIDSNAPGRLLPFARYTHGLKAKNSFLMMKIERGAEDGIEGLLAARLRRESSSRWDALTWSSKYAPTVSSVIHFQPLLAAGRRMVHKGAVGPSRLGPFWGAHRALAAA
jgi:hypothetical protein